MNMESPPQERSPREEVLAFLNTHPEYRDEHHFSQEETAFVIKAVEDILESNPKDSKEREDLVKRAFDARMAVRGGAETAVIDGGEVVGVAKSSDEAKGMMFDTRHEK